MGRLSIIKSHYARGDVARVLSKLLARQASPIGEPEALAEQLVERVWHGEAELLEREAAETPHKLVIAAVALAEGYRSLPMPELMNRRGLRRSLTIALSNILAEVEMNGSIRCSDLDRQLIAAVTDDFTIMRHIFNEPGNTQSEHAVTAP